MQKSTPGKVHVMLTKTFDCSCGQPAIGHFSVALDDQDRSGFYCIDCLMNLSPRIGVFVTQMLEGRR